MANLFYCCLKRVTGKESNITLLQFSFICFLILHAELTQQRMLGLNMFSATGSS
ncbi:hypothetical protein C0J52_14172 [Blattella germanica]|nr:hypothetical protein C0J52_14172 [Blattella germanica]